MEVRLSSYKVEKMETYESTIREKNVDTDMVFNSYHGPNGWMHWFFNDG